MATTAKARVTNYKTQSQLFTSMSGTAKTERRRSRSRSRQRIDSQLVRRADEIPIVHDTMEYIISTYGVIKDSNPLMKSTLQRSEDAAYWMRQKAGDVVTATKMDEPLKRLDAVAAQGIGKVEETTIRLRNNWDMANKQWQSRVRGVVSDVRRRADSVQYAMLESVQTMLDYLEETFEPVMLPVTPEEAAKYAEDIAPLTTVRRMVDMTWRLHAGTVQYTINGIKGVVDPEAWRIFLRKNFHPSQIRIRLSIIRNELFMRPVAREEMRKPAQIKFVDDKELTELDRRLIRSSRSLMAASISLNEAIAARRANATAAATLTFNYTRDLVGQLAKAKSLRDVSGIGLRETHRTLEFVQGRVDFLKHSQLFTNLLDWLTKQEKILATQ